MARRAKLNSSKYATLTKCSQDTASRDIDDLIKQGILEKDPGGGRSTSYSLVEPSQRRGLAFPDKDHRTDTTRVTIFWGENGEKRVRCIISRQALDDHFSNGDKLRPEAAFRAHRVEIEAIASRQYAASASLSRTAASISARSTSYSGDRQPRWQSVTPDP